MKKHRPIFLLFALMLGGSVHLSAQYIETIRTDRPGQAIGPLTAGKNIFQIQSGLDNAWSERDPSNQAYTFLSTNILRFGLTRQFEVSALLDYQFDQLTISDQAENQNGLSNLQLGFRYNVNDRPDGLLPAFGFQMHLKMPAASPYQTDYVVPNLILTTHHALGRGWGFNTNLGLTYDGNTPPPIWKYVANISFPFGKRWGGFVENYGNAQSGNFQTYFDTGVSFLLNSDLQFDCYGGWGSNDGQISTFVSFGISWRTAFFQKK